MRRAMTAALTLVLTMTTPLVAMDIVRDGRAATAIVIPDDALPAVQFAAEELQYHVRKASGAELTICSESGKMDGFRGFIYVGSGKTAAAAGLSGAELDSNCFIIKQTGDDLYLLGNDLRPGRGEDVRPAALGKLKGLV